MENIKRIERTEFDLAVRDLFREEGYAVGNDIRDEYCGTMAVIELLNRKLFGPRK
jgi:hypothetical protein